LGQQLYQNLLAWPELAHSLPQIDLIFIVPDEFLFDVPFSTLLVNKSDAQTFLVNHTAVVTLPSANLLSRSNAANATHPRRTNLKVLISADERFLEAEKFTASVKALFPLAEELTLPDSSFTKEAVLAELNKDYGIYIFLGHGQANVQNPARGYIELSVKIPQRKAKRIRLTTLDLKTIDWGGTELVMLIGCETAGGKLYRGTGISGLQQEFLALGVKNVLGNLWEVEASHTISQAENFLQLLAKTSNSAYALQESQCLTIKNLEANPYYQHPHPYFWGSTVLLIATSH
jgi:CHAT domain-containing protein